MKLKCLSIATTLGLALATSGFADEPVSVPQMVTLPELALTPVLPKEASSPVFNTMGYVSFGGGPLPFPIPAMTIGYRAQYEKTGFDLSLEAKTFFVISSLKERALFLYFPQPNLKAQFFYGAGLGVSEIFGDFTYRKRPMAMISPEFTVGKQYVTDGGGTRLFSADISFPTISLSDRKHVDPAIEFYPMVTMNYGIGF